MPNVRRSLRPALLLALVLLSAASPALTLVLASSGTGVDAYEPGNGDSILGADQTTFASQLTSPNATPFDDAYLAVTVQGGLTEGLLAYRNEGRDQALNLSLTVESDSELLGIRTLSGTWSFASGVGDYDGFSPIDSGGTWSFEWDRSNDATTTRLQGDLRTQAVPEPASLAALGLAAVATTRRRKRV